MSNYLAIATVTATLQRTLQASVQVDVDGARVTTVRPDRLNNATPEAGVNIYLYDILLNSAWRSADLRQRHSEEKYTKRSQTGLDLYYLLSCYGNDVELEPQRLMGSILRTLNSKSIVTQEMIRETVADSTFTFLADSNLAEQLEGISVSPVDMDVEEISKIWSVFFQTPYALSIAYKASVILIDSSDIPKKPLPVRNLQRHITPYQPAIAQIKVVEELSKLWETQYAATPLILAHSTLLIQGNKLSADITQVRIGNIKTTPQAVSDKQITLDLASIPIESLRAGVQSLQVIHPQQKVSSNVVAFLLRPTIVDIIVSNVHGRGNEPRSADVTVLVDFTIEKTQQVTLVLTEFSLTQFSGYSCEQTKHRRNNSNSITFAIHDCLPGSYLVRFVVDGAESLLTVDTDRNSPTFEQYIGPVVIIP
jgi:Pvc16 N-terminal domain